MKKIVAILVIALAPVIGCKTAKSGDLVGTWVIDDSSREDLPPLLQKVSGRVVLNGNGTFSASELPEFFEFGGSRAKRSEAGNGAWRLVPGTFEENQRVQLDFREIADWKDSPPYSSGLFVSRDGLYYFIGDPDEGHRVMLIRRGVFPL